MPAHAVALAALLSLTAIAPAAGAAVTPEESPRTDLVAAPEVATAPKSDALDANLGLVAGERPKPPLSFLRISGEVLAGVAVCAAGGVGGDALSPFYFERGLLGGALIAPLAVYAVGALGDETGSLGWTYLGGLAGLGVGGGVLAGTIALTNYALAFDPIGGWAIAITGLVLAGGAMVTGPIIGFNYSREYEAGAGPDIAGPTHDDAPRAEAAFRILPMVSVTPEISTFGAAGRF